jgi:riboflavin biosynthesis pyrimidine reductase
VLRLYGGQFGLPRRCIFANFVSSIDGVVALGPEHPQSGSAISGRNLGDRFVMGLLRACADAVLIGAGTLRATPNHRWTAEHIYPAAAEDFGDLRRRLGRSERPLLIVVTARGDLDADHSGLHEGALIITTDVGAERLRGRIQPNVALRSLGDVERLPIEAVMDVLRSEGHEVVLTEGGPTLIGQILAAGLLDELFLTVSPAVFGRSSAAPKEGLVEGVSFSPSNPVRFNLLSVRSHGAHLFLRYACANGTP